MLEVPQPGKCYVARYPNKALIPTISHHKRDNNSDINTTIMYNIS